MVRAPQGKGNGGDDENTRTLHAAPEREWKVYAEVEREDGREVN